MVERIFLPPSQRLFFFFKDVKPVARVDFGNFYPDGGWGWVILAAATLVHFLTGGIHLAYGSLFLRIQENFGTSDTTTGQECIIYKDCDNVRFVLFCFVLFFH